MSKIMVLSVSGALTNYQRIVCVEDEKEFIGTVRANTIKELLEAVPDTCWPFEKVEAEIRAINSVKVALTDTGLDDVPSSKEDIKTMLKRVRIWPELLVREGLLAS